MTETLRGWLFGIVGVAVVTAVTLTITPENKAKRVVALVCGLVMMLAIMRPIRAFDYGGFRRNFARLRDDAAEFSAPLDEVNENIARGIIEEKYAAYILDKGESHGLDGMTVSVTAKLGGDGFWYPDAVAISAAADAKQKRALEYDIETGLGIPPDEIAWAEE